MDFANCYVSFVIAANRCRPYLTTPAEESNDYINAVFLNVSTIFLLTKGLIFLIHANSAATIDSHSFENTMGLFIITEVKNYNFTNDK